MRITGGIARGIPLAAPRGGGVRPATDMLRQAVFSSLAARVSGSRFLDLFAGSGAYGLEALSRGAAGGSFVEQDRHAIASIRRNLAAVCRSLGRTEAGIDVLPRDAVAAPLDIAPLPDLVFIDPPYEIVPVVGPGLLARLAAALDPAADPVVVFEMPGEVEIDPGGWTLVKRLGRGRSHPTAAIYRLGKG
jgi:16S rRNA (guanine966-N2)-methyltransferase